MTRLYTYFAEFSARADLWCPGEPNNSGGDENAMDIMYYTDSSSLFCINDDNAEFWRFAYVCELTPCKCFIA